MVSEPDTGRCASLLTVPRTGVDMRQCASKDARPQRRWIWGRSHIDWRKERVLARTLGLERRWIVMSHIGWGGGQRGNPKKTISASGGSRALQDESHIG